MKRVWAVAEKEAKQFLRDRLTMTVAVAMPLGLVILYGTALTTNVRNLGLVVRDEDNTPLSRRYVAAYAATDKFRFVPARAGEPPDRMLDDYQARAVLHIPAGFDRDWRRGQSPAVELVIDGTDSNSALIIRNIAHAVSQSFQPQPSPVEQPAPPVSLAVRFWYNPGLSDGLYFGSGALGLVLILFPALLGAIAVSREMELGTMIQAYASRMSSAEWVVGKAIPYLVLGLLQAVMCFAFGVVLFGYGMPEHTAPLVVGVFLYLGVAVLFGMMAGNLTGTQSAAIQAVQFGAFLVSLLLSGFLVPIRNMPLVLQWLSNIVPARHFIEVTRDAMLRGSGWDITAKPLGMLCALLVFFFGVNVLKMRRMKVGA